MSKRKSPREKIAKEREQPACCYVTEHCGSERQLHSQMHCSKKSKQEVVEDILSNFFLITGHEGWIEGSALWNYSPSELRQETDYRSDQSILVFIDLNWNHGTRWTQTVSKSTWLSVTFWNRPPSSSGIPISFVAVQEIRYATTFQLPLGQWKPDISTCVHQYAS